MTNLELFRLLGDIREEHLQEAEQLQLAPGPRAQKRSPKRAVLVAALILLTFLLVGCAVVYAICAADLRIGNRETTRSVFDPYHREIIGTEPVSQQVLTYSGLQGSPGYQAAKEWFEFLQTYDPDGSIRKEAFQGDPEILFPDTYLSYHTYSQEMVDKLNELADKYGLQLLSTPMEFSSTGKLTRVLSIDHVLLPGSTVEAFLDGGACYPQGNFWLSMNLNMPQGPDMWQYTVYGILQYCRKDCLSPEVAYLDQGKALTEWNYKTASGATVLIVKEQEGDAYFFCDCGDATYVFEFRAGFDPETDIPDFERAWMTDRQIEQIADALDWNLRPQLPDAAAAADESHPQGWEIEAKQAIFDGSLGRLVLHLTAPKGTELLTHEVEQLFPSNDYLLYAGELQLSPISWSIGAEDDGDGLENTADIVYTFGLPPEDAAAFPLEAKWTAHVEDLQTCYSEGFKDIERIIAQGVLECPVSFQGSDQRSIEFLEAPLHVTAPNCDVTLESIRLHCLGVTLTFREGIENSGSIKPIAILDDGTQIPMITGYTEKTYSCRESDTPIDLDKVRALRLPDGTELPLPQSAAAK